MKRILLVLAGVLSLAISSSLPAAAQEFPADTLTIIVPRAPGGGSDNIARVIGPALEKHFGTPVVIENRPDATAVVGAEAVARSKPDGYTLYLSDNAFYQNPAIIPNLPYDPVKDFTAVTLLARSPVILIVSPSLKVDTATGLVEYAKAHPGSLTFGSGGIGASTHLAGVQFNLAAGTDIVHVPFKSSGPAMTALLGGHIDMQFGGISSARQHVEAGSVVALGVTGEKRSDTMPDVPTLAEAGVPGVTITSVWGLHAPADTPIEIRRTIQEAVKEVMAEPDVAEKLHSLGYQTVADTPEEHQAETEEMISYWIGVGKKIDLTK
ncbi:tripartite tricarboxylate transporter substrate binding protein [Afifella sp. IM 167]|uniref:Bug family tripartite tricarboxylate transporter substrate binding protein n=1 Tax=Afifella sp. IM 167 TaxID=2033586 RepID=UPI001CCA552A|nr:tripartite tricarboxylate transporter substrate binding protein [Afifella sp. IM 167]MBZ8132393.1 LacI family transcriptional regulator [Afifella sp. IM 167]